jgi:uncharacterized protein
MSAGRPDVRPARDNETQREDNMKTFDVIVAVLLVVGGLNWGLVALANFDLVAILTGSGGFGMKNALGSVVYGLVGLSALYQALLWRSIQRRWSMA